MSSIVEQTLPDAQPEAKKLKLGSFVHGFLTGWRVIHVQQAKNVLQMEMQEEECHFVSRIGIRGTSWDQKSEDYEVTSMSVKGVQNNDDRIWKWDSKFEIEISNTGEFELSLKIWYKGKNFLMVDIQHQFNISVTFFSMYCNKNSIK